MKVKEVERTANVAWSPKESWPIYIAAGTAAQQLDASFSTSAALELYQLNLNDPGNDLTLVSTLPSDQRFHKLAWGSCGTLVGGCDGGVIEIFNTSKLINKEEGLIAKQQKHSGPVRALDFNAYQSNLLASGAVESEIYIWDLNNLNAPMTPGSKVQPPEDLTSLSWNKQVQHILATAFASRCVVWDLRKNDPIIKLTDTACRLRWSAVAWNPDVATQLCLASEEDQSPFIQLWDLRFATSPVKVLEGHQKGVLSISWCAQDTELMLSCGKDNKILCWNPNTTFQGGELICKMTSPSQWNFDVSWCPRNPALFSTCSFDGHVSVSSLVGAPQQPQTSTKIADSFPGMELFSQAPPTVVHPTPVDLRKPPKWLKRPATTRFGFGGKLIITENRGITLCQVTAEPGLIARANLLDGALRADNCIEYCQGKVAASLDEDERTLWKFLSASFSSVPREEYLNLLGFRREDISDKLAKLRLRRGSAERLTALGRSTDTESDLDASDELGDSSNPHSSDGQHIHSERFGGSLSNGLPSSGQRAPRCYKISTTDDVDGLICEALLMGDTETAVELCVEDARWAEAIILAMTGGSDLLAKTQHRYLQENSGCLSKLVYAVVTEDWVPVIQNCDVSSWKEALVAALTHSSEEFPVLCEALGERLEPRLALLCFLCAGNLSKLVSAWMAVNNPSSPEKLQDLVEIVMLLKRAVELRGRALDLSGGIADLLSRYAIILASEGNLEMALSYLGSSNEEAVVEMRERLYYALGLRQPQPAVQSKTAQPQRNRSISSNFSAPVKAVPPVQEPASNINPVAGRQGSPGLSTGLSSRAKHVLDPSVTSTPASYYPSSGYGNSAAPQYGFQPSVNPVQAAPYSFQSAPSTTFPAPSFQSTPANFAPPPTSGGSQPPGWNDPPALSSSRPKQKKEVVPPPEPITTPLIGGPAPNVNGYQQTYDPYQQGQYQPGGAYGGAPPPQGATSRPPQSQFPQPPTGYQPNQAPTSFYPPPPTQTRPPSVPPTSQNAFPTSQQNSFHPAPPPPVAQSFPPSQPPLNNFQPVQLPSNSFPPMSQPPSFPPQVGLPQSQAPPPQNQSRPPSQPSFGVNNQSQFSVSNPVGLPSQSNYPPPPATQSAFPPPTRRPSDSVNPLQNYPVPSATPPNNNPQYKAPQPYKEFPPVAPSSHMPPQPSQPMQQAPPRQLQQPAPTRKAIPEEHIHLQTVLEELRNRCITSATNPQAKRKLDDVSRKLEALYDSLAESRLSPATLQGLHGIAQRIQNGDYAGGLLLNTQMVSGPDFAQLAPFMPGVKVLLQTAMQLQVYL